MQNDMDNECLVELAKLEQHLLISQKRYDNLEKERQNIISNVMENSRLYRQNNSQEYLDDITRLSDILIEQYHMNRFDMGALWCVTVFGKYEIVYNFYIS